MDARSPQSAELPPVVRSAMDAALDAARSSEVAGSSRSQTVAAAFAPLSADDGACRGLLQAVERFVRWDRRAGYELAAGLQLALHQAKSPHFPGACLLFADAQINLNHDLALHSLEGGFLAARHLAETDELDDDVYDGLLRRMRVIVRFYRESYGPRPYEQLNPLSYHIHQVATWSDLQGHCPELRASAEELTAQDYRATIAGLGHPDELYWRVLALRALAQHHAARHELEEACATFDEALALAVPAGLDTEIGHLRRQAGYAMRRDNRVLDARMQFEQSLLHEAAPEFAYWRALSARELGDLLGGVFRVPETDFTESAGVQTAAEAYREGRRAYDEAACSSVLPIARAVAQQMLRSTTDNALSEAALRLVLSEEADGRQARRDLLAECESAGPRNASDMLAESYLALAQPQLREAFRDGREAFQRQLLTFAPERQDEDAFGAYLADVARLHDRRRPYFEMRSMMSPAMALAHRSDGTVSDVLDLRLPGVSILVGNVGIGQSVYALIDAERGEVVDTWAQLVGERDVAERHHAAQRVLAESALRGDQEGAAEAVDELIEVYRPLTGALCTHVLPLVEGRRLVVVPRLSTSLVPWQLSLVGEDRLIDHCDVSYVPTLAILRDLHGAAGASPETVGVVALRNAADPTLGAFEGTFDAARDQSPWLFGFADGPMPIELLMSLNQTPLGTLLVACHGDFYADDPLASVLKLQDPLTVSEVMRSTDLVGCGCVALGACESGLGRSIVTAEYLGLPLAFLCAGALSVVSALWPVDRLATAILLGEMLRERSSGFGVTAALANAQRSLRGMTREDVLSWADARVPVLHEAVEFRLDEAEERPFTHPYYWGGFVTMGDV